MGNTISAGGAAPYDLHATIQSELPDFVSIAQLGRGKFTKSFLCRHTGRRPGAGGSGGGVDEPPFAGESAVVKVYLKRGDRSAETARRIAYAKRVLARQCAALNLVQQPNLLPYQAFLDSGRGAAAFLLRQHFLFSLYDRLNTRPFFGRS
jgi:hypothetical protein